jgi:predicted nucleic acid-binding protein
MALPIPGLIRRARQSVDKSAVARKPACFLDFFIGAHAVVLKVPLLTRDAARYRTYYPTAELIAPNLASSDG